MKSFAGIVFIFLVTLNLLLFPILGQAADYTFIDLGVPDGWTSSYAYGINDLGEVVGSGYTGSGTEHAFLWDGNNFIDLNPTGWIDSAAYGINNEGTAVGNGYIPQDSTYRAFQWKDGVFTDLGVLPGWGWSEAQDINNKGYIVGHGGRPRNYIFGLYAFLWIEGNYIDLTPNWLYPEIYVYGINDNGNIVGYGQDPYDDYFNGNYHAILWEALEEGSFNIIDLHPMGWEFSYAYDINYSGAIVGQGRTASYQYHALLWDGNNFTDLHPDGWIASDARGINDSRVVVGWGTTASYHDCALLWDGNDFTVLHPDGWESSYALGINKSGVVVGYGVNPDGLTHAFIAIKNQPPIAHAGGPYIGHEGDAIIFDASGSYDPDDDQLSYRWDFNDDGVWDTEWLNDPIVIQIWDDDWTGIVKLEVSDGVLTAIDTDTVTVNNVSPSVDAGQDCDAECGVDQFAFSGGLFDPGLLDTHTIEWDFGDGCTATDTLTPNHKYCSIGEFTVTLTVTDDDGGVGYDTLIVTVNDNLPPEVSMTSPEEIIYINTQMPVEIIYTVKDLCDSHPGIKVFLDGEVYNEDSIDLSIYLNESEHTLSVQATDASGNVGEDSVAFIVVPEPIKSFVIDKMKIRWAHDHPCKHWENKTRFTIYGSFELPDEYLREDLSQFVLIYIQIADQMGVDRIEFKEFKRVWIYLENYSWRHKEDDSLGEDIDIQTMMIHWPYERGFKFKRFKKKLKRQRFYILGELSLNGIDVNALPNEAKIILEFPVSPYEKGGSLAGKEIIEFTKFNHTWFYYAPIDSKNQQDDCRKK